jgi:hypothetical protein
VLVRLPEPIVLATSTAIAFWSKGAVVVDNDVAPTTFDAPPKARKTQPPATDSITPPQ